VVDLAEAGLSPLPEEDAVEAFETFEENALAKARYFHARSGGRPVIADDSGLEVTVLGGQPGVRSRRWSGRGDLEGFALDEANNAALLAVLRGVADRRARYVCAVALVAKDGELIVRGEAAGVITHERRGAGGFGYDPYFASDDLAGRTFGESTLEEKARVSHRARAFGALVAALDRG
jgi:XTP/dITP diphosphohydrolase